MIAVLRPKTHALLMLWASCMASHALAEVTEERIKALEAQLNQLEQSDLKQSAGLPFMDRIKINGYVNFVLSQSNREVPYWSNEDDNLSLNNHSSAGIRFSAKMSEKNQTVIQFDVEPEANGDFEPGIEWFYLQHQFTESLSAKIGRISTPVLNYSEEFDVGFAYPWVRPPEEIYAPLPLNEFEGISLAYDNYFGDFGLRVKGIWGYNRFSAIGAQIQQDDIIGLEAEINYQYLSFRAAQLQMKFTANLGPVLAVDTDYTLSSVGFTYDNNQWMITTEIADYHVDNPNNLVFDENSYYVTAGWYIKKCTPYFTYAHTESEQKSDRSQRGQYLGLRYSLTETAALTFEVQYLDQFKGSNGLFNGFAGPSGTDIDFDSATIFHLAYQAVF